MPYLQNIFSALTLKMNITQNTNYEQLMSTRWRSTPAINIKEIYFFADKNPFTNLPLPRN